MKKPAKSPKPVRSKVWRTFLKIDSALKGDLPPECDSAYLVSKGIEPEAPIVLGLIREHLIPLFDSALCNTTFYQWFLVHNRESGVPTTEDDKACYLDITLTFANPVTFRPPVPFVMTTPTTLSKECGGWDLKQMYGGIERVNALLDEQCRFVIHLIKSFNDSTDTFTILKHMRQSFHYFANIGQMRIS
jgi:hypothetical protein